MPRYYDTYEQETLSTLNTRTGVKKKQNTNYSSYWMDFDDDVYTSTASAADIANPERIVKLASVRRAIANFVRILTNDEKIDVVFSSGKDSYTDGKQVVIAAEDDSSKFDSMVGLALHEGSHCLLSDFNMLEHLTVPKNWYRGLLAFKPELRDMIHSEYYDASTGTISHKVVDQVNAMQKMLGVIMNVIEDRRIDSYVYRMAPGYRPYYEAMYTKYFFNSDVTKSLKYNPDWRVPTFQNYTNWLINIFHPDFDRNALPGLSKLVDIIDLKNIRRFDIKNRTKREFGDWKFTKEYAPWYAYCVNNNIPVPRWGDFAQHTNLLDYSELPLLWTVANDVLHEIIKHVANYQDEMSGEQGEGQSVVTIDMDGVGISVDTNGLENLDMSHNTVPVDGKFNDKKANDAMKKIKQALEGKSRKKQIKQKEKADLQNLESADAEIVEAGDKIIGNFPCLILKKINRNLMESDMFPFAHTTHHSDNTRSLYKNSKTDAAVVKGVQMGQVLVHRLQVRNDPTVTHFTRQPHGKIDRRILAQLGMEIEQVFKRTTVENFRPAMIHLSIDASGSMSGTKFNKCLTVATALAYVSSKIKNVEVVITIRGDQDIPMVAVVYDSRTDTFQKVRNLFPYLYPMGSTPEGLCFKATLDMITECAGEYDVYFINFSDGEPGTSVRRKGEYNSYGGETAYDHTRRQVNAMRDAGVKVMSYFISEYDTAKQQYLSSYRPFKRMYGEDATFVNIQNVTEVLRTLNKLLLKKMN